MSQNIKRIQNSTITINNYPRERSPTPESSNSSVSEPRIKRRKKLDYLVGEGAEQWEPSCQLIVNEINLTKRLKKLRDQSVDSAKLGRLISDVRILSLSHIFPVAKEIEGKCVLPYLNSQEKEAFQIYSSDSFAEDVDEVSDEAVLFCHKSSKSKIGTLKFKNKYDDIVFELCSQLSNNRASAASNSEAAFINRNLMPFINKLLVDDEPASTTHAMMDSPCVQGVKPDFALSTKTRKKNIFLFYIEVKRNEIDSKYQAESDFVKLMKQMKFAVDQQLKIGVKSPISFGLLCEGFSCEFFTMKLAVEGIYLPVLTRQFSLVQNVGDLVHVPAIVETFGLVKEELQKLKEKISKATTADRKQQKELMKSSFKTHFKK